MSNGETTQTKQTDSAEGAANGKVRIAAMGDLHVRETSSGAYRDLFAQVCSEADVLVLCGDLTEHGLVKEAEVLADELRTCKMPVVAVLGNHDYESELEDEVSHILTAAGVNVLEGDGMEILGVGFAGVKGFCGGFGSRIVPLWGERLMKEYVREGMNQALQLERALSRLPSTERLVVAMHYAPIAETIAGEHPEIYTYLGNSRLAEVIDRFPVRAAFHGHAHHGTPEGKTGAGVPVFNTALPLMRQTNPERPFALVEV
ncbi:MAG TPA: metallophosphoesterase [Chloroflexota bacterium]|nr:metallophosphoesterase [Chloroflexota bacterium]